MVEVWEVFFDVARIGTYMEYQVEYCTCVVLCNFIPWNVDHMNNIKRCTWLPCDTVVPWMYWYGLSLRKYVFESTLLLWFSKNNVYAILLENGWGLWNGLIYVILVCLIEQEWNALINLIGIIVLNVLVTSFLLYSLLADLLVKNCQQGKIHWAKLLQFL